MTESFGGGKVVIRRRSFSPDLFSSAARYDYARVNKTDLGQLRKARFTLTARKKCDQLFVSAPANGGTTALGEIVLPLTSGKKRRRHKYLDICALGAVSRN